VEPLPSESSSEWKRAIRTRESERAPLFSEEEAENERKK
jgi:hypothetical protein